MLLMVVLVWWPQRKSWKQATTPMLRVLKNWARDEREVRKHTSIMSLKPNERTQVCRNRYNVAMDVDAGRQRCKDNMVEIQVLSKTIVLWHLDELFLNWSNQSGSQFFRLDQWFLVFLDFFFFFFNFSFLGGSNQRHWPPVESIGLVGLVRFSKSWF